MMTLHEIAESTGTDRAWHQYTHIYDKLFAHLRDQPIRLLEMGVLNGAGLEMWSKFLTHPDAVIVGLDIHP